MESTLSVSKGVFVFPNGFNKQKHYNNKKSKALFEKVFTKDLWYAAYRTNWNFIEQQIKDLHHRTYSVLLNDVVSYIKLFQDENDPEAIEGIIPSATLLTGINQPDHESQFMALIGKIRDDVTPHIAMVNSQDGSTLKHLVENAVWQLIYGQELLDDSDEDCDVITQSQRKLKKNQCTMKTLHNWYHSKYKKSTPRKNKPCVTTRSLVIIIPDFESFNSNILQDFVMIVSSYVSSLPIVFVFGVATCVSALHKSFPYHVSSKLLIKVFHSLPSSAYMNQVLEEIFLTHTSPLHLSGNTFQLLSDVFLFYDFSVTSFIQGIKYCMMEHYYDDNTKALFCECDKVETVISYLSAEDLSNIRLMLSFRQFLEAQNPSTQIKLFEDDFFRKKLCNEITKFHDYLYSFYACVRLLTVFLKDLPKNALGQTIHEVYIKCTDSNVTDTPAFKESMQLIKFQSQVRLVESIRNAVKLLNSVLETVSPIKPFRSTPTKNNVNNIQLNKDLGETFMKTVRVHLQIFLRHIEHSNTEATVFAKVSNTNVANDAENVGSRHRLKEKLLDATRLEKNHSEFEMVRSRFVIYLEEMFGKSLQSPHTQPFHEIFFFSDVSSVKKQIIGSPRGAVHTALSDPVNYLHCSCCHLPSPESIVDTLPDVCLAYKLHQECGKHINLYDWLQAFAAVLRPDDDDELRHHDATVQARFTRAVAELQFLGFIKSSKRKTDHVIRLTW